MASTTLLVGDVRERIKEQPDESVHCVVTSPPYLGLRDYGMAAQIGLEPTPDAYVAEMVALFREVRRVLRSDGTLWLNLGDSYSNQGKWGGATGGKHAKCVHGNNGSRDRRDFGLASKQRLMIPARVALALQADDWFLRDEIIWHKPAPMPTSVTDRTTPAHEMIYMFSRSPGYYYDMEAIKEPSVHAGKTVTLGEKSFARGQADGAGVPRTGNALADTYTVPAMRQPRSAWTVNTKPFKGAHFATFPPDLIRPCILAGTPEFCCEACGAPVERIVKRESVSLRPNSDSIRGNSPSSARAIGGNAQRGAVACNTSTVGWKETCQCNAPRIGGTVLDPFGGAGTTALVAQEEGRNSILFELNPEYAQIARERLGLGRPIIDLAAVRAELAIASQIHALQARLRA